MYYSPHLKALIAKPQYLPKTAPWPVALLDKRECEKKDRPEKERVKALKNQDYSVYVDLIKESKNQRILEILKSTDEFLKHLGARILL